MHDEHDPEGRGRPSRRSFIQTTAAFAAASVVMGAGAAADDAADASAGLSCDCSTESAVPLFAAAFVDGRYVGLAASPSGARLFPLKLAGQRVSLGDPMAVELPAGFAATSLGVVDGRLVVAGGVPFVWDSYEVDDTLSEDLRALLTHYPKGLPTQGRRRVDVMGLRPAAFALWPLHAEPLALPATPKRLFATVSAVGQTAGGTVVLLIGHSGDETETWYTSNVDVWEGSRGSWATRATAANLGESGPNYLAVSGEDFLVGINSSKGAQLLARSGAAVRAALPPAGKRLLGVMPSTTGFDTLTADDQGGVRRRSSALRGTRMTSGGFRLPTDEVVATVPVVGAPGETLVLGRRSAWLMTLTAALAGRFEVEAPHVV